MMNFVRVCGWDNNGKFPNYHETETRDQADAALISMLVDAPEAFIAAHPTGDPAYWTVNSVSKTIVHSQADAEAYDLAGSWAAFRVERNTLLMSSDWTQYTDSPLDETKAEWATRSLTLQS